MSLKALPMNHLNLNCKKDINFVENGNGSGRYSLLHKMGGDSIRHKKVLLIIYLITILIFSSCWLVACTIYNYYSMTLSTPLLQEQVTYKFNRRSS